MCGKGIEQIDLLLDVSSTANEAGLVFPTPSPATVTEGSLSDFESLERAIVPDATFVDDWWGFAKSPDANNGKPEVLSTVTLGSFEATTLRAGNTGALRAWLRDNGFVLPVKVSRLLGHYVAKGWSFVAVKLTASEELAGKLEPIRITFETKDIVYPMRLAAASEAPQHLRLYLVGESRMDARQDPSRRHLNASRETIWAGSLPDAQLSKRGSYLTVIDMTWDSPRDQIAHDIEIVDVAAQDRVSPSKIVVVRTVALLGVPVGLLIGGWLAIGLLVFFGALVARTRIR